MIYASNNVYILKKNIYIYIYIYIVRLLRLKPKTFYRRVTDLQSARKTIIFNLCRVAVSKGQAMA